MRPRKIMAEDSRAIGQWVRRNNEITASEIVEKLQSNRNLIVSRWTVRNSFTLSTAQNRKKNSWLETNQ